MNSDPCRLCGSTDYKKYLDRIYALGDQEFDLLRCKSCGLIRVEPMPDAEAVAAVKRHMSAPSSMVSYAAKSALPKVTMRAARARYEAAVGPEALAAKTDDRAERIDRARLAALIRALRQ